MTTTNPIDIVNTVKEIKSLENADDIVRIAVPNMEAAKSISKVKRQIKIPIIADIHFDYRLALQSIKKVLMD